MAASPDEKKTQVQNSIAKQSKSDPKHLKEELDQLKTELKAQLQQVALRKFPKKIVQLRQLRAELASKIEAAKKNPPPCTIPVPDSLLANQQKLNSLNPDTVATVMALNPNLRCFELTNRPLLLKNCEMPVNQAISGLIDQILPHLYELDDDLSKVDYSLRLLLPRMREGEYLGTEMLHEASSLIAHKQNTLQMHINELIKYYDGRFAHLQKIITYPHLDDYRLSLVRFDERYCSKLSSAVNFMYMAVVLVHDMVKKNQDKLAEYRIMAEETKESYDFFN